ncbi:MULTISPECIES: transglycosylase domain-containing protein [unclassified Nonomuraea]|uniref:transglycosylase domain-containing protein n=1 Tax=unclassified Nonomuraea TaxID=2593643 RepID=UPI0033E3FCE1
MAAQSYEQPYEPPRREPQGREPQGRESQGREPQRRESGRRAPAGPAQETVAMGMPGEPAPRVPARREGRRRSDQETMISEAPRRARGRGAGGNGGPGGPGGPGGSGGPGGPQGPGEPPRDSGEKRPAWRRFLPSWKIVLAGVAVVTAGVFGMIAVAYANMPMPTEDQVQDTVDDQGSTIYYANGETLAKLGTKRVPVKDINGIPRHVQDAVIAAENSSFREDAGISFSGMVRSVFSTVSGQQVQGASTITQQMARNYYDGLSQERSVQRKIKEIFVAVKLNKSLTKDQILLQYLNTIYFGRGAYGIGAAAQQFFGKPVKDLTPQQGAYLAGRIQNPDAFDRAEIAGNMKPTEERYVYVVGQMAKLDPAAYGTLPAKSPSSPKRVKVKNRDYFKGLTGYMVEAVLNELKAEYNISKVDVETGGYKITSTFDKHLMQAARDAVNKHTAGLNGEINATLAAVDPTNGRIRAFYGGDDYEKDAWNDAFLSQKQAASAFKPYVLAAWLDSGYSLRSYLPAKGPLKLEGTTPINNDHASSSSSIDVVDATAHSINTAFAKMGEKVTLEKVIEIASRAGLSKDRLEDARNRHHYLITIGSGQVTAVEQAGGYSIFANGGKHFKNHVIIKVKDRSGTTKYQEKSTPAQVISPEAAADATVALQAVVKQGTGRNAALYDRPVAGKTGTNNENKEAWFVGFTPQLSTAVGMFRQECRSKGGKVIQPVNDNCPWWRGKDKAKEKKYTPQKPYTTAYEVTLGSAFQGATYPSAIWKTFMTEAMKGQKVEQFPSRVDTGVPENLAPKPVPTPTATKEPDEEQPDDVTCVMDPCDDDSGRIITIDPNENNGFDDDNGLLGGGQDPGMPPFIEPETMPSGREQW